MAATQMRVAAQLSSGVRHIAASYEAFAALKEDGSVLTWGEDTKGGNSDAVAVQLSSGVRHVTGNRGAFAALKDGSVVTWGEDRYGGNSGAVKAQLSSGVRDVAGNCWDFDFVAVKEDDSVVTWPPPRGVYATLSKTHLTSGVLRALEMKGTRGVGRPGEPHSIPVTWIEVKLVMRTSGDDWGIRMSKNNEHLQVMAILGGGAAARAIGESSDAIRVGDIILQVNGVRVGDMPWSLEPTEMFSKPEVILAGVRRV